MPEMHYKIALDYTSIREMDPDSLRRIYSSSSKQRFSIPIVKLAVAVLALAAVLVIIWQACIRNCAIKGRIRKEYTASRSRTVAGAIDRNEQASNQDSFCETVERGLSEFIPEGCETTEHGQTLHFVIHMRLPVSNQDVWSTVTCLMSQSTYQSDSLKFKDETGNMVTYSVCGQNGWRCQQRETHFTCGCPTGFDLSNDLNSCVVSTHVPKPLNLFGNVLAKGMQFGEDLLDFGSSSFLHTEARFCAELTQALSEITQIKCTVLQFEMPIDAEGVAIMFALTVPRDHEDDLLQLEMSIKAAILCGLNFSKIDKNKVYFSDEGEQFYKYDVCGEDGHKCSKRNKQYECSCDEERVLSLDRSTCVDVDECVINTHTCDLSKTVCENLSPGFHCPCKPGFALRDNICQDIDECRVAFPCENIKNSHCVNLLGSYHCECNIGYKRHTTGCLQQLKPVS